MIKIRPLLDQKNVFKGKWVNPMIGTRAQQLIDLVQIAYKKTKQGSFINSKGDVASSEWIAMDFDDEPKLDVAIFYRPHQVVRNGGDTRFKEQVTTGLFLLSRE